jgi:hypothetical protein
VVVEAILEQVVPELPVLLDKDTVADQAQMLLLKMVLVVAEQVLQVLVLLIH